MEKVQVRFRRFAAAFDEVARLCESSGSEHSAAGEEEGSADLSELVDSFLERDSGVEVEEDDDCGEDGGGEGEEEEEAERSRPNETPLERDRTKNTLLSLISGEEEEECEDGGVGRMIRAEVESAWRSGSPEGLKRRVMSWLRHKGFDAGLCKSRWEKTAQSPAGEHEYNDVIIAGTRYIVELTPAIQFTIARPSDPYASLLQVFPQILVCKQDKLKKAVRLVCAAMRQSLRERELHVPPWRRNAYVQAKWFGPYKRTTNPVSEAAVKLRGGDSAGKSLVGFEIALRETHNVCCRGEVSRTKVGFGNLNAALNGMD